MRKYTISEAIEIILDSIPYSLRENTVDTLKNGSPETVITGIVTTFTITMDVIQKAKNLNANFIITHEPTYYNHEDFTEHLNNNPIFRKKKKALEESNITVWRFHDNWHIHSPDGILTGIMEKLNWQSFQYPKNPYLFHRGEITLKNLINELKTIFGIKKINVIGNPKQKIKNIAFLCGSPPSEFFIEALTDNDVDSVIGGEFNEWGVGEFTRDAISQGKNISLIRLGHLMSEQHGMEYLVKWLKPKLPGLPIHFIESPDLYTTL